MTSPLTEFIAFVFGEIAVAVVGLAFVGLAILSIVGTFARVVMRRSGK